MLTGEIIQNITSVYEKGTPSVSSRLRNRQVFYRMLPIRAMLLTQKANKRQNISQDNYQTIPCVQTIKAQPFECPCVPPVGCGIYRTEEKLPKPLSGMQGHLIQSVTSLDGSTVYSETSWEEKKWKSGNKYTSKNPDFYIRDNYLFITADKMFSKIIPITGLFNDPTEVWEFPGACDSNDGANCTSYLDREFPLSNDLVNVMIKMLQEELLSPFVQMREDRTNNNADSLPQESK